LYSHAVIFIKFKNTKNDIPNSIYVRKYRSYNLFHIILWRKVSAAAFHGGPNKENKQEAGAKQTTYKYPIDAAEAHLTDTIRFLIARHFHLFAYLR